MKKQWRYQAGELVELSAAGKKGEQNDKVVGLFGMIMSIEEEQNGFRGGYPYQIRWFGYTELTTAGIGMLPMKEYEIKQVRG